MGVPPNSLWHRCLAEVVGTFVLVFFGCGVVHAAVLTGAHSGLWSVAIVWGVAIMVAVYVVGGISGAHINPAITLALACWDRFSWGQVVPYIVSQLAGAVLGAAVLFGLFHTFLDAREARLGVTRGEPGSEVTAMCYGEYFPNPDFLADRLAKEPARSAEALARMIDEEHARVSPAQAFGAEVLGTLLLALAVFAL